MMQNQDSSIIPRVIIDERLFLPPLEVRTESTGSGRRIRAFGILRDWKINIQKAKHELRNIHG